jgi:hypothetical protein
MRYPVRLAKADTPAELIFVWAFTVFLGALLGAAVGGLVGLRALIDVSVGNDAFDLGFFKWSVVIGAAAGLFYCVSQLRAVKPPAN